jgi:hypothetical protein
MDILATDNITVFKHNSFSYTYCNAINDMLDGLVPQQHAGQVIARSQKIKPDFRHISQIQKTYG